MSDMKMSDNWAVVQLTEEEVAADVLAPILTEHGGMIKLDARRIAARNRGILFEAFQEEQADAVAAALRAAGYSVRAIPSSDVPALPKLHQPPWIMFSSAGLAFPFGLEQKVTIVRWPSVFVVNSTVMHLGEKKQVPRSQSASSEDRSDSLETVVKAKRTPVTDVIAMATDGEFRALRIVRGRTKLRDAASPANDAVSGKLAEYLEIVETIVGHSPYAMISDSTREILDERREVQGITQSESWIRFEELAYHRYNRWMLLMVVLRDMENGHS